MGGSVFRNYYKGHMDKTKGTRASLMTAMMTIIKIVLSAHQQMSGSKNYGIFTQWNSTQQKEGAYTLCKSMDGTGEHYAK